jgi:type II secretory pathway pseudopilin PulG
MEILVVISLLIILIAAVVTSFISVGQRAYVDSTRTLLRRIELAVETYRDRAGFYPPDGLDGPVKSRFGADIYLSTCLYETLGLPLNVEKPAPGGRKVVERYSSPIVRFRDAELERSLDDPRLAELADAWGVPIHYDRLEGEHSYSEQSDGTHHVNPVDPHPLDPREVEGFAKVLGQGQNPGRFDVWSHGPRGHAATPADEDAVDQNAPPVPNWQLGQEQE